MPSILASRQMMPEVMDDPQLGAASHHHALRGLARLNAVSRSAATIWPAVRDIVRAADRPVRLLDIACGGGDVTIKLAQRAECARLPLTVHGCDVSEQALDAAQQRAKKRGAAVEFFQCDVMRHSLPDDYDLVVATLFLHHLTDKQVVRLLGALRERATHMVISDLCRTWRGLLAAIAVPRVLTRSPVVRIDGPRSVLAAFTPTELRTLAQRAGLEDVQLRRCFPQRMVLTWSRPA